jgi:AcrR family transcriptional regulator
MAISKREMLVEAALNLFMQEGFHAVGIDRILTEAGVAKMTLYNHFKSKDELILAALRLRDERFRLWFDREVERRGATPRERVLASFDVLGEWFAAPNFSGCTFINAAAEFGDPDTAIHRTVVEHKRMMLDAYRKLTGEAGADRPDALAAQLNLLAEGAIVATYAADQSDAADMAKHAADVLLAAAGVAD